MRLYRFATAPLAILCLLLTLTPSLASAQTDSSARVDVSMVPAADRVAPGGDLPVAVVLDHDEHWHSHTNDPQVPPALGDPSFYIATAIHATPPPDQGQRTPDAAVPTEVEIGSLRAHPGFIQWPDPETFEVAFLGDPVDYQVFAGKAVAYLPVTVPQDAEPGEATLRVWVTYQSCDDATCLAPVRDQELTTTIQIVPQAELAQPAAEAAEDGEGDDASSNAQASSNGGPGTDRAELFSGFDPSVWAAIRSGEGPVELIRFDLFGYSFELDPSGAIGLSLLLLIAAVGGLLLNFTPCVLPVVPLKVMSLSQSAGSLGRTLLLGAAMSGGVIGFWLILGGLIATLTGFSAINELFQRPAFTIGVGVVIAAMAVGMCGLFSIQLPQAVYRVTPKQESVLGSVGFGVMTAVLSTPCTAPFMGSAAAWAVKQPPSTTMATFATIGGGMALPYFLLAAFPALIKKLPRTGPGSELIKQEMGLLMLAAASYFVGVGISTLTAEPGIPPSQIYWWPVAGFIAAAGVWLIVRVWQIADSNVGRVAGGVSGAVVVIVAIAGGLRLTDPGPIDWVYYTPQRFEAALADGDTVVMEFTAEWCLNCKALEQSMLHQQRVVDAISESGVTPMKVDITSEANVAGNAMLEEVGRVAIPALVVFKPDGTEVFNSDAYTAGQVVDAIQQSRLTAQR